jgi:hypothetical protein
MTKKHWGSRSPAVVELAQLKAFVGPGVVSRKELRDLPDEGLITLIIERTNLDEKAAREVLDVTRGGDRRYGRERG